ncbi:hypothetical protein FNU77_00070 (plasmid) [Prescottella equi]|nr:hypothetical protein FNU77_00070 [Prescottella equi]
MAELVGVRSTGAVEDSGVADSVVVSPGEAGTVVVGRAVVVVVAVVALGSAKAVAAVVDNNAAARATTVSVRADRLASLPLRQRCS